MKRHPPSQSFCAFQAGNKKNKGSSDKIKPPDREKKRAIIDIYCIMSTDLPNGACLIGLCPKGLGGDKIG